MRMNIYILSVQYSAQSNKFVVQKISESATSFLTLPKIVFLRVLEVRKNTKHCTSHYKVRKVAKIRNRYNQVPHLTQDTTWESDKNTN